MKFKIFRFKEGMRKPIYDSFEFEPPIGMTVRGALFHLQQNFDDSIAFHYSCRGAVCGTCAMLIKKVPRLACRTQLEPLIKGELKIPLSPYKALEETVKWGPDKEILIEPLPHLPVKKDLIVDMDKFFEYYKLIEPVFQPTGPDPDLERLMDPEEVKELELYTNCILCASCFGSCPVDGAKPNYIGPAALAKLYRFFIDPREGDNEFRLILADKPSGWWDCEFHGNCKRVCPKDVPPLIAIAKAREKLNIIKNRKDEK